MPSFVYRSLGLTPDDSYPESRITKIYIILLDYEYDPSLVYPTQKTDSLPSHRSKGNHPVELLSSLRKNLGLEPPTTEWFHNRINQKWSQWMARRCMKKFCFSFRNLSSPRFPFGATPNPLTALGIVPCPAWYNEFFDPLFPVLLRPSLRPINLPNRREEKPTEKARERHYSLSSETGYYYY